MVPKAQALPEGGAFFVRAKHRALTDVDPFRRYLTISKETQRGHSLGPLDSRRGLPVGRQAVSKTVGAKVLRGFDSRPLATVIYVTCNIYDSYNVLHSITVVNNPKLVLHCYLLSLGTLMLGYHL